MTNLTGYFMEPQNFSVNDGDGIRTIVFFAGCPLRCEWCSNPEGLGNVNKVAYRKETCISCGKCAIVCPEGIGIDLNRPEARAKCTSCGKCVEVCPTKSRIRLVNEYSVDDLLKIIERQEIFYRYSGGGVTFSGGEATMQQEMLRELTNRLYDKALNLAIETSGYFDFDEVKDILGKLDLIFIDMKLFNDEKHKKFTKVSNEKILSNIKRLKELDTEVVVRIPLILGVNADDENIRNTAKFVKDNVNNPKIELLPYHSFGDEKYEALGHLIPSRDFGTPSFELVERLKEIIRSEGVEAVSYR